MLKNLLTYYLFLSKFLTLVFLIDSHIMIYYSFIMATVHSYGDFRSEVLLYTGLSPEELSC